MSNGVIYVATGEDYLDLACASAATLRATNPDLSVDLFTDLTEQKGLELFDQVHPVPVVHVRAKLECMALSRFERTLFLDADTLVVGDLGDLWGGLDRFDLALAHDVRRASSLIQEGFDVETPYAFPQFNSGVVLYQRSPAMAAFLADWMARFHRTGVGRDQIVLKDALWSSDLRFYVLPPEFNLRRVTLLDAWEPMDAEVKIIHSRRLMDHLRQPDAGRISDLASLLDAERLALAKEWRAKGDPERIDWFTKNGRPVYPDARGPKSRG